MNEFWRVQTQVDLRSEWTKFMVHLYKLSLQGVPIYPAPDQDVILRGLTEHEDLRTVKVVIVGQDPYPHAGANGRAFAVNPGVAAPPSLKNLAKLLKADLGQTLEDHTLGGWVAQGVCLVNVWPVSTDKPRDDRLGHAGLIQYEDMLNRIMPTLARQAVFVGLGKQAQERIDRWTSWHGRENRIYTSHPSPLSAHRGFNSSKLFTKINEALARLGHEPIVWGAAEGARGSN